MINESTQDKTMTDWTVEYTANNGEVFTKEGVLYYEIQDALMELSRTAYMHHTSAKEIRIY